MKFLSVMVRVLMIATVGITLAACGKKKNGSTATTPASQCTWNGYTYVNRNGTQCTPANGSQVCPANGRIVNQYGQVVTCTPGQPVNVGYTPPNGYPYPGYPNSQTQACASYLYQYGVPYVPMILQGQYVCVRYDLLQGYAYNTNYHDNYNYYYAYPPYTGNQCSTQIDFGGNWGYVGVCF